MWGTDGSSVRVAPEGALLVAASRAPDGSVILRDARASNTLSLDRYDMMRGAQKEAQPEPSAMLRINEAPVLPPQRAPVFEAVPSTPAVPAAAPAQ